jgi:phage-related protein
LIGTVGTALKSGLGGALSFIAAHPVMLTIALLTAAFVLLWQHSETFRDIVRGVFDKVGGFVGGLWDKFKNLVGNIKGLGQQIVEVVTWPYRTAFNGIADIWNNTVGRLSFKVPSWVPGIGGNGFDIPDIPKFHSGGVVPGAPGSETLALLQAGERVIPAGGGGGVVINVYAPNYVGSKDELGRAVTEALRDYRFRNGMN